MGLTIRGATYRSAMRLAPKYAESSDDEKQKPAVADGLGGAERRGIAAVLSVHDDFRHFLAKFKDERVVGLQGGLSSREVAQLLTS